MSQGRFAAPPLKRAGWLVMLVVLSLAGAGAASPTGPGDLPAFGGLQPSLAVPKPTDDWAGVILRFRQQEKENFTGFPLETIAFWERGVELAKRSQSMETLEAVHKHFNRVPYVSDQSNYRVGDRWSTPLEFIANGGDCECYATAKFMALVRGGWPREHVYVVNGRGSGDEAHTIVIVSIMDNNQHLWWALDNRREQPEPLAQADFVPTTAMSEHHTWLYGRLRLD
jgi:predicted transglutaminase-like cysteine proteinase